MGKKRWRKRAKAVGGEKGAIRINVVFDPGEAPDDLIEMLESELDGTVQFTKQELIRMCVRKLRQKVKKNKTFSLKEYFFG